MKFQDEISNLHTYIHTYTHTDKPKPICPPLFQSWGHKNPPLGLLQNDIVEKLKGQPFLVILPLGRGSAVLS